MTMENHTSFQLLEKLNMKLFQTILLTKSILQSMETKSSTRELEELFLDGTTLLLMIQDAWLLKPFLELALLELPLSFLTSGEKDLSMWATQHGETTTKYLLLLDFK